MTKNPIAKRLTSGECSHEAICSVAAAEIRRLERCLAEVDAAFAYAEGYGVQKGWNGTKSIAAVLAAIKRHQKRMLA